MRNVCPLLNTNTVISLYYEIHGRGPAVGVALGGGDPSELVAASAHICQDIIRVLLLIIAATAIPVMCGMIPVPQTTGQDLVGLLDHLAIEKTAIIGQSMGGWTTVEQFAQAYPNTCAALVLANSTGGIRAGNSTSTLRQSRLGIRARFGRVRTPQTFRNASPPSLSSINRSQRGTSVARPISGRNSNWRIHLRRSSRGTSQPYF